MDACIPAMFSYFLRNITTPSENNRSCIEQDGLVIFEVENTLLNRDQWISKN